MMTKTDQIGEARSRPFVLKPWLIVLWCLAGLASEESRGIIRFQQIQIDVLREIIGRDKRIILSDRQRVRLAEAGKELGRKKIGEFCSLFTPDTILRWYRELIANHHTYSTGSPGRPKLSEEIIGLVVMIAKQNPSWGYDRIQGELKKLGHTVSDTSVANILHEHGLDPSPHRENHGTTWSEFLQAHWECLAATDFTTVDVWTPSGLKTIYLLFVIELKSRCVQFVGSTEHPNEKWMLEAVERTTKKDGLLGGEGHSTLLIMDNDSKFTAKFKEKLRDNGVKPVLTAVRAPNMNAFQERFILSYKSEMANRMIFFGKQMLDHATKEYLAHYHEERPHQGLDNELILPFEKPPDPKGELEVTKRLGGLLKSYRRRTVA
ncbi:Integrase core domain protein [Novipirellula aureliae]|uniref:Integrase core domain protein n=1 Tax=Novipirellula aureliae TaxID=2527966 RepID=A0A5C6DKZ0_9BACT|nr:integrase core domain-containing protein [Novipirellula aureliae]TWU37540.1 Integrase core domain protein [Novipirellula aureliae]